MKEILKKKPIWSKDELSHVLKNAEYNTLVSTKKYHEVYGFVVHTYRKLLDAEKAINHQLNEDYIVPALLFILARSSFIASIHLILSGQAIVANTTMRLMIEQIWYGLHIAMDPAPFSRQEIWINRNHSDIDKKKCKKEFSISNVSTTHKNIDKDTYDALNKFYEHTIDFGAHPNQFGVIPQLKQKDSSDASQFNVGILSFDERTNIMSLKMTINIAVGYLKVIEIVFKNGFNKFVSIKSVEEIIIGLHSLFTHWKKSDTKK